MATSVMMAAMALALAGTGPQSTMGGMPMPAASASPAACPATPAPVPAEFAGWATATTLAAGADAAGAPALPIGTAATVTLGDATTAHYAVPPGHVPAAGSHGGLLALTVATPGRYRVGLGAGAWIDLVQGSTALRSATHGHGPACSTLKKIVDFDLQPGRYLIQLSGNAAPTIAVMVVRAAG